MGKLWNLVLAVALTLSFASEANSKPVAYYHELGGRYAIVLMDDTAEACPFNTHVAVPVSKDGEVATAVIGCWLYEKYNNKIHIFWMNSVNDETLTTEHDASDFTKFQNDPQ